MIDQSPHWVVGSQKIYNQLQAWKLAKSISTVPSFYFYEKEYDSMDWTKEPVESWEDLCRERCLELRNKYKKLSLFYSAGRDSHHILRCFAKFNIHLDELIVMDHTLNQLRRQEYINYILPQVKTFVTRFPKTTVKTMYIDEAMYESYYYDAVLEDPYTGTLPIFQPTSYNFYMKNVLRVLDLTHGVILGVDKPRIILENGKFYSSVLDKTMEPFITDLPNLEYFYYAPTMPKLHVKQTWMTLKHIELAYPKNIVDKEFMIDFCGNAHSLKYDEFCLSCGRGPAWNINLGIQNGKSKHKEQGYQPVFLQMQQLAKMRGWKSVNYYMDAFDDLTRNLSSIFNQNDARRGVVGVYGKKYYLKDQ
jgi:hypothetical protein